MGDIVHFSCNCGYDKELFLGGGVQSCNRMHISRIFPQEMVVFNQAYENGEIDSYCLDLELLIRQSTIPWLFWMEPLVLRVQMLKLVIREVRENR